MTDGLVPPRRRHVDLLRLSCSGAGYDSATGFGDGREIIVDRLDRRMPPV